MSKKHYKNEIGTDIIVNCGCNIVGALLTKLKVKLPDNTFIDWPATIEGTDSLKYTVQSGDFALSGEYCIQASLELSGWSGLGETAKFTIYNLFK